MYVRCDMARSWLGLLLSGFAIWLAGSGCGSDRQSVEDTNARIGVLGRLYGEYAARLGRGTPANEAGFKDYLKALPAGQRKALGLEDLEAAFISPRDGKPYVVLYGNRGDSLQRRAGLHGQPIVIYEQKGMEGNRLVATAAGAMGELSEAEFKKLVPQAEQP